MSGRAGGSEDRWTTLLRELVDTDSGPDDPDGIHAVLGRLAREFTALGFSAARRPAPPGPDVLVARRPGAADAVRVLLLGHADTVFTGAAAAARPFTVRADGTATGPGIADMKAGLVVMLAALAGLPSDAADRLDVTALVNGDEESGSAHSREVVEEAAGEADVALVFEPGRPPALGVHARRGAQRYRLHVRGRPAHTGVNPEDGANAIEALAHHVLALQELGRRSSRGSVTAVLVEGGSRPNIVPAGAFVHVDTRADDAATAREIHDGILALAGRSTVAGTSTEVEVLDGRPPYVQAEGGRELAQLFRDAATEVGVAFDTESTGGSSDGNFTSALGVPTLDGLGAVGAGYHTEDEYIELDSLASRAALCRAALVRIARRGRG